MQGSSIIWDIYNAVQCHNTKADAWMQGADIAWEWEMFTMQLRCQGRCIDARCRRLQCSHNGKRTKVPSVIVNWQMWVWIDQVLRRKINRGHRWTSAWKSLKTETEATIGIRPIKSLFWLLWTSSSSSPLVWAFWHKLISDFSRHKLPSFLSCRASFPLF